MLIKHLKDCMQIAVRLIKSDAEILVSKSCFSCLIFSLRSEDAFVITRVANLMEVKVLYVQQDLPYEISSYWRFNV
jgi:hypothetical protein